MGISRKEQEIWQACDDLLTTGKTPKEITGEAIGNRLRELKLKPGSLTYRYRYRDSWMEARGLTRETLEEMVKPCDIIERGAAIFKNTIESSIREAYETRYQEARDHFEAAQQALEGVIKQKEGQEAEITVLKEQLSAFQQKHREEREKRLQFEERAVLAEELLKENKSQQEELKKQFFAALEQAARLEERLRLIQVEIELYRKENKASKVMV